MKKCIVNYATDNSWFLRGQQRLVDSLKTHGFVGDVLALNQNNLECPSHRDIPYAFKPFAIAEARKKGYDLVLWLDSAIWAIKPIELVFEFIEKEGYLLFRSGWNSGEWCSDEALKVFKKTREESFKYPHLMACAMGFDFRKPINNTFLDKVLDYAKQGTAFRGAWTNKNCEVSEHPKVLGHRHDQTVASFVAWDLEMRNWVIPHKTFLLYYHGQKEIKDSIVFLAQGGCKGG